MINVNDIVDMGFTEDELASACADPDKRYNALCTGQLKSIGNMVLRYVTGMDVEIFNKQLKDAHALGVECVCEDRRRRVVGLSTTVSLIRDTSIICKQVIVPAGQVKIDAMLDQHNIVSVYVVGVNNDDVLSNIKGVYVAGWLPVHELQRFIHVGGQGAFRVNRMSLAVAPVTVLKPIKKLHNIVRWHHMCV